MELNEQFMQRCLELAENGLGHTAPNPMVGCVIVHQGKILGEGYHRSYGGPHAEVNAIADAIKRHGEHLLKESTLYVNLEPCSHHGKTPPCADLVIARGIPKVVIGNVDPFEKVQGQGIRKLQEAGIEVTTGMLEKEGAWLNRRFFTFHTKKRPFMLIKFAQTEDGFIAPEFPDPAKRWITGPDARKLVHQWRTQESGIMIGSNTALNDNPLLTAREWPGRNPVRIVIDREGRLPRSLHVFDQQVPTLAFSHRPPSKEHHLEFIHVPNEEDFLEVVLRELHQRNLLSVLVEGGTRLLNLLIERNCWDEARIFIAPKKMERGIRAPQLPGNLSAKTRIGGDELTYLLPSV